MIERIVTFFGKFAIMLGAVSLALYLGLTFLFDLINASNHLEGLAPRDWFVIAFLVTVLIVGFQRMATWVTS